MRFDARAASRKVFQMMDARAPQDAITLSVPVWISKNSDEDDYRDWLRGKLEAAGWDKTRAREVKGSIAVSMRIATPPPPAGLSRRKQMALEAGETVWRSTGLPATTIVDIMLAAMGLGQVVRLHAEKVFTLGPTGRVDIVIEAL